MRALDALRINVEIEGLREQIVTLLRLRKDEFGDEIEAGLKKAVSEIDVPAMVKRFAKPALEKAVKGAVECACSKLLYDHEFNDVVFRSVLAHLQSDPSRGNASSP